MAGMEGDEIDAIVVATSTADLTFPSVATMVQQAIGNTKGYAFDVQAVCAGFVYALSNANALIASGQADTVMVIGAETFSRIMDWTDRSTCVLFGDGAGALILSAEDGDGTAADRGILSTDLNSDGRYKDLLYVDGGVSTQNTGMLRMEGKEVFRHAVEKLAKTAHTALDKVGLGPDDVTWVVPHQANIRIIQSTAKKLGVEMDRVIVTVQDHGNTSAASIPLALSVGVANGQIKKGDLVVTEAIGGGLAWGAEVGLSRNDSADLVESVLTHVSDALVDGESVKISSFGTFAVREKAARVGRNPKTGEEVPIHPRRVLTFRPSHLMKDRVAAGNKS